MKDKTKLLAGLLSVIFCVFCITLWGQSGKDFFHVFILFFCTYLLNSKAFEDWDKRKIIITGCFSAVFAFFAMHSGCAVVNIPVYMYLFISFWIMSLGALNYINLVPSVKHRDKDIRVWLAIFVIMVVMWLPSFAACGPLSITQDSSSVLKQALGRSMLNDSNPVLYTLLVSLVFKPFETMGISLIVPSYIFGFGQMCIVALILSYSLYRIYLAGHPIPALVMYMAYFVLTPVFSLNGITLWKDIPYNAVLLLVMIQTWDMARTNGKVLENKVFAVKFAITVLSACFLRGNGFLVMAAVSAGCIIAFSGQRKKLAAILLPLLVAVKIITGPVYEMIGLNNLGSIESMAMPVQQIAAAICDGAELTEEQTEFLESYMSIEKWKKNYVPASVDHIKFSPDFEREGFDEKTDELLKVWLQLAPDNFDSYVTAWLEETKGYWSLSFHSRAVIRGDVFEGLEQIENKDIILRLTGKNASDWFYAQTTFIPLGILVSLTAFCMFAMIYRRSSKKIVILIPVLATWLGLMVGAPTYADGRYLLVVMYAAPFILYQLLTAGED